MQEGKREGSDIGTAMIVSQDDLTERIIGAAIEVHKILGRGFVEKVYEEALCVEFMMRNISFQRQVDIVITYKGTPIKGHRLDLLVADQVIVEVKAVDQLHPSHSLVALSYLRATQLKRGLILNFGASSLKDGIKRVSM